ncbi:class I SAM-dependent methyltransferase [Acidiphilium sp.]|uniref:class I SAM-dependent methyltransferase n=1 Tax=Acidiphilium sp. TaxID=527 RepID=UPI003CFFF42F
MLTSLQDHAGIHYLDYLARVHHMLSPRTYLEIGTRSGDSLSLANCSSVAIDPKFQIEGNVIGGKEVCLFYQSTSDAFFLNYNPMKLLGGSIDLAFLDGLHLFEQLLLDFINTEQYCRRDSVIMLHDCLPSDVFIANRIDDPEHRRAMGSKPDWWTGDVWKLIPILRRWRSDISLLTLDCAPTGLVIVSNLDPTSSVLRDSYDQIVSDFRDADLASYGLKQFYAEIIMLSAAEAMLPAVNWRGAKPKPALV